MGNFCPVTRRVVDPQFESLVVIVEVTVVTLVKHRLAEKDRIGESARICCVWVENRRASTVALLRLLRTAGVLALGRLAVT